MDEAVQKTIDVYRGFITFPEITEKYLKRPPFKYLFQIFLSVNKKTGFAGGLLNPEEQDPEYYNTPERKMSFLKKLISHVYDKLGKQPPLRPLSVIKGEECEKTNEFLRDMFTASTSATSKQSLKEPVAVEKPVSEPTASKVPTDKAIKTQVEQRKVKENNDARGTSQSKNTEQVPTIRPQPPSDLPQNQNSTENSLSSKPLGQEILKNIEKDDRIIAKEDEMKSIKMARIAPKAGDEHDSANLDLPVEEIRALIQKITQNSNPLGKLIDYAEDDLGNMSKEYKNWMRILHEATTKLEKLESEQDDELQSYTDKIQQLDEQILDFQEKIAGLNGKVFKTEQRISQLLQKFIES